MLPLVLAGLGALVLSNPLRNGRRGAAAKRRILRRVTKAARTNKRSGGTREACHASVRAQFFAAECGLRSKRISRAVVRGIKQGRKKNPAKRRARVTPSNAAARLAKWRWHHNPAGCYRLADGDVVTAVQLRRMFMGKIPGPAHRRLLGITKAKRR
jgi:hypothetical protein